MNQSLSLITDKNNEQITNILDIFKNYLLTINTGRITPKLIDNIYIEFNSKKVKIAHVATIMVKKNIIIINPWEKENLKLIEKSILETHSKFFPNNNGKQISITIPPLTKSDRENILKELKKQGEQLKISIRQARRNHNNLIKLHIKKEKLSSNLDKIYLDIIQKQTDNGIKQIDKYIENKKNSIMNL
jgi:ribosome recycling factor